MTQNHPQPPPSPPKKPPKILLIICGGIAAYKALEIIRRIKDKGWTLNTILTKGGRQFITPLSVSSLSGTKTYTDLFSLTDETEMGHIRLARDADLIIIAPATANMMARAAMGLADDLASTVLLATNAPILMAPAMNPFMWQHPATQNNHAILKSRNVAFIGPDDGAMACGEHGTGRLAETEAIIKAAQGMLQNKSTLNKNALNKNLGGLAKGELTGKTALVTSGPTHEPIDSLRHIANKSSGKQGYAIASALKDAGAEVTLITGPTVQTPPSGVEIIAITTAQDMLQACLETLPVDIAVCAAAVADWTPDPPITNTSKPHKIKKIKDQPPKLTLKENPDILASIAKHKKRPRLVIGFAAETHRLIPNAQEKRQKKGCDWILANEINAETPVFGADENCVHLITESSVTPWPRMSKKDVATKLTQKIIEKISQ